jgi:hypothetical protein
VLEAGARSDRLEQELEGKLPPFFSFFLVIFLSGVVAIKKAMAESFFFMFEKKK